MPTLSELPWMFVCLSILHPATLPTSRDVTSPSHLHSKWVHPHDVAPLVTGRVAEPQDHSGALMAEEFKACLISLGYDVENDKQVGGPGPLVARRTRCCQAAWAGEQRWSHWAALPGYIGTVKIPIPKAPP